MKSRHYHSRSEQETQRLAADLARQVKPGDILCLFGDLGSGKTTFVKGLASGLAINPRDVNSPTFVLLNIYDGKLPLYHFDFYRLQHPEEIAAIGYDEFLFGSGVAVVEWSERFGPFLPAQRLELRFDYAGTTGREITCTAYGARAEELLLESGQEAQASKVIPKHTAQE